jgi:hypothetical protein
MTKPKRRRHVNELARSIVGETAGEAALEPEKAAKDPARSFSGPVRPRRAKRDRWTGQWRDE